ncbi:hypothetical protein niasHT_034879 [Heterodera trifolii]|uniref:Uncharacterized protein n=1 Tax=Heterodera trifolii TaxID=157864 RepID=A0ABD2I2V5_9BILA
MPSLTAHLFPRSVSNKAKSRAEGVRGGEGKGGDNGDNDAALTGPTSVHISHALLLFRLLLADGIIKLECHHHHYHHHQQLAPRGEKDFSLVQCWAWLVPKGGLGNKN